MKHSVKLHASWQSVLQQEFSQEYMQQLRTFLLHEKQQGKVIFPHTAHYFAALNLTPFDQLKVVILGQDPYHGLGQAHGLCFSVPPGVAAPPSLVNIFKELQADLAVPIANHGCLVSWAQQGVLLLNSVLTVEQSQAAAHQGQGWERFTDAVIAQINGQLSQVVFILWGNYAQKKGAFIDTRKHFVIQAPHPSPLSAHRGFFGQRYFSRINDYLVAQGKEPIHWQLPDLEQVQCVYAQAEAINQAIAQAN